MRSEEEIRLMYRQYVFKYAKATIEGERDASNQYFGAAISCGRTLGKDVKRIRLDFDIAKEHLQREARKD